MPYRKSWNKLWRGFRRVCTLPLIVLVKFLSTLHIAPHSRFVPLHADLFPNTRSEACANARPP